MQIVQLLLNPRQAAAEEVPVADLAVAVGEIVHQLVPILVDHPVAQHPGRVRDKGAAEPVREDLVGHSPPEPIRRGQGVVIHRLLPADRLPLAAQAVPPQPGRLAVPAPEAETVPGQLRLGGGVVGTGKEAAPPLRPSGAEGDFLVRTGKFAAEHQRTFGKALLDRGAQGDRNGGSAGNRSVGPLIALITGVENRNIHRGCILLASIYNKRLGALDAIRKAAIFHIVYHITFPAAMQVNIALLFHFLSHFPASPAGGRARAPQRSIRIRFWILLRLGPLWRR